MSNVGHIYVDPSTNRSYKCIANITISPTLMNKRETKSGVWRQVLASGTGEAPNTFVLVDEEGNQVVAVLVDEEVIFDATADDIREGKTAVTEEGVTVGEKFIPSYLVSEGTKIITTNKPFVIQIPDLDMYDYTKLMAILCPYNETVAKSVGCEKVVINDNLYEALSTVSICEIQLIHDSKSIYLGIMNETKTPYLIRYFTYKEVY